MPDNQLPEKGDEQLQSYNQEWMKFFNAMDEVFFSFDPVNKRPLQISGGCEKVYGVSVEKLLANDRLWFEMIHPDDKHIALEEVEILKAGEQVNNQYRIIRADGDMRWIEKKIIPTFNGIGEFVRADGIARDITHRKLAEEEHARSENFYRQIVETAQEGIWTIDEHENINFVNKKICEILEYPAEEILGKKLIDFTDEEGKAHLLACLERRRNGVQEIVNTRYVTKSGREVWTNVSANPIFDDHRKFKGALAMVTDITKRRADELALKTSEANLRTIFENTDSAYVLFNDDLRIISFNTLAAKDTVQQNKPPLEINKHIKNYFTDDRWVFVLALLEKIKSDGSYSYELTYTKTNGEVCWQNVRWVAVRNSDGSPAGFILTSKDNTEAKLAALEREKITNDLIRHNKDLEQFTYIVSHNLRSPVANIIGLTNILHDAGDEPEVREEVVDRISVSITSVDHVIRDLNRILQIRKPGNELKEEVDFKAVCEDIKAGIFATIHKENIQLHCDCIEVTSIYTIRSYMYSILYNLVQNSIKYRRKDVESFIHIKTLKLDNKTEIRVKDNGKGIDLAKNGEHIFGLYKRFDTTVEGKGMGLFMVKTQIETLGGTISIESEPGVGTEFIIQF